MEGERTEYGYRFRLLAVALQVVVAVTLTNLVFWLVPGAAVGVVRGRFTGTAASLRDSFA